MMTVPGRRKQIYLGVMILSGIALVVDRCLSTGGVTGPAAAMAVGSSVAPAAPVAEPLSIPELPFPRGITSIDPECDIRDFFEPPHLRADDVTQASPSDNQAEDVARSAGPYVARRATFLTHHTLNGVLVNERLKIAIVNGQWVRMGQSVDGCTLIDISGDEVLFKCGDGTASLKPGGGLPPAG